MRLDMPHYVTADRLRVKQVFINLLSNAIKYNRAGGCVEVRCEPSGSGRIRISFQDTGAGLSADQLTHLFQPFNRLGQETSTKEGTGIGLVVSKRLVELMAGEIGVHSTEGVGSVFWLELNAAPVPGMPAHPVERDLDRLEASLCGGAVKTLLYVEDNPANLMLVEQLLDRRSDFVMLSASDGTHGIEIARASMPDVILMDINLPGISGIQAMRILADDPATARIPVIALSANAIPSDIEKGLAAGFFLYLTKPIKFDEFMKSLDAALNFADAQSVREQLETLQ
jgi:CheY-like chemotaxis protein